MVCMTTRDVTAHISRLFIYPVKSCAGIEVDEAVLTETGLALDRNWMVVDVHGQFVTQREHPSLALVCPHIQTDKLLLQAPGMRDLQILFKAEGSVSTVKIWDDNALGKDAGDEASLWFTQFLSSATDTNCPAMHYRLVRFDPQQLRVSNMQWTKGVQALNQFSDGFPLLLLSEASHAQLNERLQEAGHASVSIERFRPNVVVSGLQAHDEDHLDVMYVKAESKEVLLKPVKPCPRCPIPNIDPLTAHINSYVGELLQSYRKDDRLGGAVTFGMNVIVLRGSGVTLRVGQKLSADFDFS